MTEVTQEMVCWSCHRHWKLILQVVRDIHQIREIRPAYSHRPKDEMLAPRQS